MLVNMKHLKYILASLTTIISMLAEAQGNITGRVIDFLSDDHRGHTDQRREYRIEQTRHW